jgi:hypothetical protein
LLEPVGTVLPGTRRPAVLRAGQAAPPATTLAVPGGARKRKGGAADLTEVCRAA